MTQPTQEEIDRNRDRRPLYKIGDTVEVAGEGVFKGWHGQVEAVRAMQTIVGLIATYAYDVRMLNLAKQVWSEEDLRGIGSNRPTDNPYAYHVIIAPEPTTDGHTVWGISIEELPGCESQGDTVDEAMENLADAYRLYTETLDRYQQKG